MNKRRMRMLREQEFRKLHQATLHVLEKVPVRALINGR